MGDSAGGNLCTSLCYWLIENNERKPDLLLLFYPALTLDIKYTPALAYTFQDYLLNYGSMSCSLRAYVPEFTDTLFDYYLSPLQAPKELLQKMPKTRVCVGTKDALRDESYRWALKMYDAGVDIHLYRFTYLGHGLLNVNENTFFPAKLFNRVALSCLTLGLMDDDNIVTQYRLVKEEK